LGVHARVPKRSTAHVGGKLQTLDHPAGHQVLLNDFLNVGFVDKGVPNGFGVDHHHGAARATIETPSFVHPHPTRARDARRFNLSFAVLKSLLGLVLRTAGLAVVSLVEAKKHVALVIRAVCM